MNSHQRIVLYGLMILGCGLVATGVGLASFTDMSSSMGVRGVQIIGGLIGLGLLLLVPSKIILTLILMRRESPKSNS